MSCQNPSSAGNQYFLCNIFKEREEDLQEAKSHRQDNTRSNRGANPAEVHFCFRLQNQLSQFPGPSLHNHHTSLANKCNEWDQKMIWGSKASARGPTKRAAVRLPSWNRPHTYDTCAPIQMRAGVLAMCFGLLPCILVTVFAFNH